ncbi:MAG: AraC family transcriptional regulator [Prevotellaceae bacterium]|jgi:AraC-like DNA-binding protein|nr:AraC family transcriptional regulator [Prevotellaceae bacterium]
MSNVPDNPNLHLLNVGFSEHNATWNWKKICSPFARIYYVKSGGAKTHVGGKTYLLEPDHLYLVPPFTLHDDECDAYFSLYYIHFYEMVMNRESVFDKYEFPVGFAAAPLDLLLTERLVLLNPDSYLTQFDPELYDNVPSISQSIAQNSKMPIHVIVETQGILVQLVSRFLQSAKVKSEHKDARINKSLQYIHENIGKDISVSQLAGASCITEDHFIRIFKREMHLTPLQYVNMKKIEKAQLLLLTTDMPVRDVAFELAIDNVSYFNRIFRQHTGTTPSSYRNGYNN